MSDKDQEMTDSCEENGDSIVQFEVSKGDYAQDAQEILCRANKRRKLNSSLCDLIIKVDGKSFFAHKYIMVEFSPYFEKNIVTDRFEQSTLEITGITAEIFEVILEFAYTGTGKLSIPEEKVEDLLRSSCLLEAVLLVNICEELLGPKTNVGNFWRFYGIASDFSCSVLANYVNKFVIGNFPEVCQTECFLNIKPEMLIDAIKSDDLNVPSEEIVLDAVLKWTNHDKDRELLLAELLSYVRLAFIRPEYLHKCAQKEAAIRTSVDCVLLISKALAYKLEPSCVEDVPEAFRLPRHSTSDMEKSIVLGFKEPLYSLNIKTQRLHKLKPAPVKCTITAAVCSGENFYVWGVTDMDEEDLSFSSVLMQYNLRSDSWAWNKDNFYSSYCAGLVELNGSIFKWSSCGTARITINKALSRTSSGTFKRVSAMPDTDVLFCCFRVEDVIYAIGRSDYPDDMAPTFARYDPDTKKWTLLDSLLEQVGKYLCCYFEGKIYVFDREIMNVNLRKFQVYDIASGRWKWGASLSPVAKDLAALEVIDGQLTLIDQWNFPTLHIERFSPEKNLWEVSEVKLDSELRTCDLHFFPGTLKLKRS